MSQSDPQEVLPVTDEQREHGADLICAALGYVEPDCFHEPDESFCATIYAAAEREPDAFAEIAAIGREQRAASSELPYAISRNLHRLKELSELLRRPTGYPPNPISELARSIWLDLDQAHRDYHEMRGTK